MKELGFLRARRRFMTSTTRVGKKNMSTKTLKTKQEIHLGRGGEKVDKTRRPGERS